MYSRSGRFAKTCSGRLRQQVNTSYQDQVSAIRQLVWEKYFLPIHGEILSILRTKQHLIEGGAVPASFEQYLKHSTQEEFQHSLWSELKISSSFLKGTPWPRLFYDDVVGGLADVRRKHALALREVEVGTEGSLTSGNDG